MTDGGSLTFDVEQSWRFPTLGRRVVPVGGGVSVESTRESWVEHDTPAGDLAASGVRLVRAGDTWTLSADGADTSRPGPARTVPPALRDVLLGVRAGAALRVARRVDRERTVHAVHDAGGVRLGEIADVHERSVTGGAAATVTERRRIEIAGWDGPFPAAAAKRLTRAGAVPVSRDAAPDASAAPDTVAAGLRAEIAEQRLAILHGDIALRRGEPAVHRTRVAIRRLRSILRVVPVTDPERTATLDAELRWLAGRLGAVRDAEVLRTHLQATLARGPEVPPATVALIDRALDDEHASAQATLTRVLAGRRYFALLTTLRAWADDPPLTEAADEPALRLAKYVRTAERTLARRLRRAVDDEGLHRARKAAKRVRYAAALVPGAADVATRARAVQERLGDHQDAVVASAFLHRVGATATGEAAFGCGVLWAHEMRRARKAARPTT